MRRNVLGIIEIKEHEILVVFFEFTVELEVKSKSILRNKRNFFLVLSFLCYKICLVSTGKRRIQEH